MELICLLSSSRPALAQTSAWGKLKVSEGDFISARKGIITSDIDDEATLGTEKMLKKGNTKCSKVSQDSQSCEFQK